ncbi:MAG: ABC transporter substrate-binding protein [Candidatus Binataceae bacterium]|jgi:phospholipid transport system substrate-binding protein
MSALKRLNSSRQSILATVIALVIAASVPSSVAAAGATVPLNVVRQLVARVLAIVNDKKMEQTDKQKKLRNLATANLDFDEMSRLAMGGSWRSLNAEQRRRFVPVFSSFLEDAYLDKVQNYSDQGIEITRGRLDEQNYAQVSGRIVQQGAEPIGLGFSLKREASAWKIYDISIDNVSTLHSYRAEFQRIMNDKGFDELMKQIQDRDRELAMTLGSPSGLPF